MAKVKIMYCYSHQDDIYQTEMKKWLATLRREGVISDWSDKKILPGTKIDHTLNKAKDETDIFLLLLTQNFINSEPCMEEMEFALNHYGEKRTIPIILKSCAWEDTKCYKDTIKALPKDGKPVDHWDNTDDAWHDIYEGIKLAVEEFSSKPKKEFLEEIGHISFINQNKRKVTLNDIYVYPKIVKCDQAIKDYRETIHEATFFDDENNYKLIKGTELSGKTSLGYSIFLKHIDERPVIWLDGSMVFKTINFDEFIEKQFEKQFYGQYDEWKKKVNKIAIIDDYDHKISKNFIDYLKENFSKIYILVNEEEYMVYLFDNKSFVDFSLYTIEQLSVNSQEQLIRKWKSLSDGGVLLLNDVDIDNIEAKINDIIAFNRIVPRYPFYILTILQSLEAFMPGNFAITAYGHCYNALITAQLIKKFVEHSDIDTCFNYLSSLAYDIYRTTKIREEQYNNTTYKEFIVSYKNNHFISDSLIKKIENIEYPIIKTDAINGNISFIYPYTYYYFIGKYFAENWNTCKEIVEHICDEVYYKENSYILIFIIHHTQNKELLDNILLHCMCSFDGYEPAKLTKEETSFMADLIKELPKSILSSLPVNENREKERNISENNQIESDGPEDRGEEPIFRDIRKAMRMMEVLGQILKNRAGSFDKQIVLGAIEEVENLGLRVLNMFIALIKLDSLKDFLEARLNEEAEKGKVFTDMDKRQFIERYIQYLGFLFTMGMLYKISNSLNSEKLIEPVSIITEKVNTPAYKLIMALITLSNKGERGFNVLEEFYKEFQSDSNFIACRSLSFSIQSYMNTHKIDYRVKQRLCSVLGIDYHPSLPGA